MKLYSLDAEASVLGGLFEHVELMDDMQSILKVSDFYSIEYRKIYGAMLNLKRNGKTIDIVNIKKELSEDLDLGDLDEIVAFLPEPSFDQCIEHSEIVKEYALKRNVFSEFTEVANDIKENPNMDKGELLSMIHKKVDGLIEDSASKQDTVATYQELIPITLQEIKERAEAGTEITGLSTGLDELDKLTGGLQNTDLIIVSGRPSMGKTTVSCNIVDNIALSGNRAMIFSIEMPKKQLMIRTMASLGGINQGRLRTGQLTHLERGKLAAVTEKIKTMDIVIDDDAGIDIHELRARAIKEHRKKPLKLIMIDYLQLMKLNIGGSGADNKTNALAEVSRGLKLLAKDLNIPIIVLSQLNRTLETRQDKRPINSDLRDSGAIEQDADLIIHVYRDEVYNPDTADKGIAEIIIGKQRNGPLGVARTQFVGAESRFDNITENQGGRPIPEVKVPPRSETPAETELDIDSPECLF